MAGIEGREQLQQGARILRVYDGFGKNSTLHQLDMIFGGSALQSETDIISLFQRNGFSVREGGLFNSHNPLEFGIANAPLEKDREIAHKVGIPPVPISCIMGTTIPFFLLDNKVYISYILDIMNTTTIHIKVDVKTREDAKRIAEEFGFSLTSLVNTLLKQIARTKQLTLSLDETPTPYLLTSLKTSEEEVKDGKVLSFDSGKDALAYLKKELIHEKQSTH